MFKFILGAVAGAVGATAVIQRKRELAAIGVPEEVARVRAQRDQARALYENERLKNLALNARVEEVLAQLSDLKSELDKAIAQYEGHMNVVELHKHAD